MVHLTPIDPAQPTAPGPLPPTGGEGWARAGMPGTPPPEPAIESPLPPTGGDGPPYDAPLQPGILPEMRVADATTAIAPAAIVSADRHVGRRIREARIQRGLSLAELGARLGVSTPQARKYEAGRNAIPATRLPALAAGLGVDLAFFFEGLHTEQRAGSYRPLLPTRPRMLLDLIRATDAVPEAGLLALCAAARAFAGEGNGEA